MSIIVEPPPDVEALDAGVIEDARARQRRHRGVRCTQTDPNMLNAIVVIWACAAPGGTRSGVHLGWTTQEPGG